MTFSRVARESAEALAVTTGSSRIARESTETLVITTGASRVARESAEALTITKGASRVGRLSVEILMAPPIKVNMEAYTYENVGVAAQTANVDELSYVYENVAATSPPPVGTLFNSPGWATQVVTPKIIYGPVAAWDTLGYTYEDVILPAVFTDNFTRGNNASITVGEPSGYAWQSVVGGTGVTTIGITGNKANGTGMLVTPGPTGIPVTCTLTASTYSGAFQFNTGIILRANSGDSGFLLANFAVGNLADWSSGTPTTIGTFTSGWNSGDTWKVTDDGTTIKVYRNGTLRGTLTTTAHNTGPAQIVGLSIDSGGTSDLFSSFTYQDGIN